MDHPPKIAVVVSLPFDENTYIAHFPGRNDAIVVDPGLEPGKIVAYLDSEGLAPAAILCTHGHSDHIAGNEMLKKKWPKAPIVIGHREADKLTDPNQNLSAPFGLPLVSPPADRLVREGDVFDGAGFRLEVYEIPGHSSGHVVFIWRRGSPTIVFGGDVLFQGSIGRTDFPGGSFEALRDGIHQKLFLLPDDTVVLSGHGPATTIGEEKASNPFVGRPAGYAV